MKPVLRKISGAREGADAMFYCPGCKTQHGLRIGWEFPGPNAWGWNGSEDKPTFTPSVLVSGSEMPTDAEIEAWNTHRTPWPRREFVCHSYVKDGLIQFLGDCTHALAGQTVPLPPVED